MAGILRTWRAAPSVARMTKLIDPGHPFFAVAWRRWLTALFPAVWGGVELWGGSPGWAMMFLAAAAYAGWVLIVRWKAG